MIFHRYTRFQPQELQHKGKAPCIVAVCSLDCKHIVIVSVLHHASRMEWPVSKHFRHSLQAWQTVRFQAPKLAKEELGTWRAKICHCSQGCGFPQEYGSDYGCSLKCTSSWDRLQLRRKKCDEKLGRWPFVALAWLKFEARLTKRRTQFPRLHTTAWSACGVPGASFRGGLREWGKWQWSYQRQWCKELPKQPRPLVSAAVSTFCRIQAGTAWEAPGRTPSQAPRDFTLPFSCWKMSWKSNLSIYWLRRLPCLPNDWTACIMHCIASQSVSASCQFRGCIASMTHPCSFHSFISHLVALNCGRLGRNPCFGMDHFLDALDVWQGLDPVMPSLKRLSERHDLTVAYAKRKDVTRNLWRFCEFPLQERYQQHRCLALRALSWLKGRHGRLVMLDSTNKTIGLRKRLEEMPGAYTSIITLGIPATLAPGSCTCFACCTWGGCTGACCACTCCTCTQKI